MTTPSRPSRLPTTRPSAASPGRPPGAPGPVAVVIPAAPAVDVPLVDAGVFEPDATALQKAADKGQLEKLEEKTRHQVLNALHSLSLLAPGVLVAMRGARSDDEQVERFHAWAEQVRASAQQWVQSWPVAEEDRAWVAAALERVVATHPGLAKPASMEVLMRLAFEQTPAPPVPGLPLPVAGPLAMTTALAEVSRAQQAFPLGRPSPEADLEAVARVLAEAGQDAVAELVPPTGTQEVRVTVFSTSVELAGKTLAQFWNQAGQEFLARLRERSVTEQQVWEAAHPEGVDLEPLFQKLREHGARLRRLALLARPK